MPASDDALALRRFVLAHTAVVAPPLLPELPLHLATEMTPLWHATEKDFAAHGIEPPFWAFAWAGGQGLARFLLDEPSVVRGRRVVDFAAGSGLVALAAARAGAAAVISIDRDPLAVAAMQLNAERLGLRIDVRLGDVLDGVGASGSLLAGLDEAEVVTAGDVCYDAAWAPRALGWLRAQAGRGALVLLGDPGRLYAPRAGLVEVARYRIESIDDVDAEPTSTGVVFRLDAVA